MRGNATSRARELRRKQTDAERLIWRYLRNREINGCKFRRQNPIGPFFGDFACPERRLVVELDGGHHADRKRHNDARTRYLEKTGWRVLRVWDNEVLMQTAEVLAQVFEATLEAPHPNPLPARGERGTAR